MKPEIHVEISQNVAILSFDYDAQLVNIVRSIQNRKWDPIQKKWSIPLASLDQFKNFIKPNYTIIDSKELERRTKEGIVTNDPPIFSIEDKKREKELIPEDYPYKACPYPHQKEAINFLLHHKKALLSLDMGLGKTYTALVTASILKEWGCVKRCLVIVGVGNTRYTWAKQVEDFTYYDAYLLGYRKLPYGVINKYIVGGMKEKREDLNNINNLPFFIIVNKEALRDEEIANKLKKLCKSGEIGAIIYDEIHKGLNFESKQGRNILDLDVPYKFALTGTPIVNSPLDAANLMRWLDYTKASPLAIKRHFCHIKTIGSGWRAFEVVDYFTNMGELKTNLNKIQFHRDKRDCLGLPPKICKTEYLEMGEAQNKLYNDVLDQIKKNIDRVRLLPNPLSELVRLRQATSHTAILSSTINESVKFERALEIIENIYKTNKCLVFSNWTKVTDLFYPLVSKYNPALVTGNTKSIHEELDKFDNDPSCRLMVGTIGAMGTGLNLQNATYVIFLDEPYHKASKSQAEDRCYRIGTKGSVTIYTLICKNTIDEKIHSIVETKGQYAEAIIKKETNLDIFNNIISSL